MPEAITLKPGKVTLAQLEAIYREGATARLDPSTRKAVSAAAAVVGELASGKDAIYGVNTGFGKLASKRIPADQTALLQRNLILSHSTGVGAPIEERFVRLMMALKLVSLGRGASGVRPVVVSQIESMLARGVWPVVPCQGSVGASGDLAPLAHMTAAMLGEGEAVHDGKTMPAAEALRRAGLEPIALSAKEGLALINGTQFSTAFALAGLFDAALLARTALVTGALTIDAAMGSTTPFRPEIHELRGHAGQIAAAATLLALLEGSEIRKSHLEGDERVQDPYCMRCQPQVAGACIDLLSQAARTLQIESNAVTDNPLVLTATREIISGGNFHAEPVAFAADQIALAISEIGAISERHIATLVDPALNFGLPTFLTPEPGINSGFMIAEVTAAALYGENKQRAMPCSVDSTPTSANQEDHVSMAAHAARRLTEMNANLANILGIELLVAAQGVDLRKPLKTSPPLQRVMKVLRKSVPMLGADRFMAPDIAKAARIVGEGAVIEAAGSKLFPTLVGSA